MTDSATPERSLGESVLESLLTDANVITRAKRGQTLFCVDISVHTIRHLRLDVAMSNSTLSAMGDAPRTAERDVNSWLLRVFSSPSQTGIFLRAIVISAAILGVEYLIEVVWWNLPYWQDEDLFITAPGVPLSGIALVFSLMALGQWGTRYVELWERARPAFDVPDERYDATVRRNLNGLYGHDHVPFLLFAVGQIGIYSLFGSELPAGFLHIGFLHFFAVTALYSFYRHLVNIGHISSLHLVDINRARQSLSEITDFSLAVCLNWFAALSAGVIYFLFFTKLDRGVDLFYVLFIVFLILVGLLLFVIPLVLLHEALTRAKQKQLHDIKQEYETLFEMWREGALADNPSVGLDMLQRRREMLEASSTWPYRLLSVAQLLLGAAVPTAIELLQIFMR